MCTILHFILFFFRAEQLMGRREGGGNRHCQNVFAVDGGKLGKPRYPSRAVIYYPSLALFYFMAVCTRSERDSIQRIEEGFSTFFISFLFPTPHRMFNPVGYISLCGGPIKKLPLHKRTRYTSRGNSKRCSPALQTIPATPALELILKGS